MSKAMNGITHADRKLKPPKEQSYRKSCVVDSLHLHTAALVNTTVKFRDVELKMSTVTQF